MLSLLTGLGWLAASLLLFLVAQRWLHREIHAVFLLITRRPGLSVGLFSLVFFPGVLLHETSHFLTARILGVRTNADTPADAKIARAFGAEGIGLFRTEHMFYGVGSEKPLFLLRKMILSSTEAER